MNIFRSLPAIDKNDFDPEEDDPTLEASWPHLQVNRFFFTKEILQHSKYFFKLLRLISNCQILGNQIDFFLFDF